MSDEQTVSYTHNTINDPNGSGNHVTGILIVSGVIALPLITCLLAYLLINWLVY